MTIKCPNCGGTGEIESETTTAGYFNFSPYIDIKEIIIECPSCYGSGEIEEN
mgnify:CR=1 FL=1|tara:strand:+ start:2741 stop:2896 length:156 start_codon:yes stop_codon:yes gene_type:complete